MVDSILGSWSVIGTFVLGVVVLLYLYLTHNHSYWRKRGVPYVKPLPLFGNMKDTVLSRKSMGENYRDIYWKLNGYKYGGAFKFSKPSLVIRDPELIKDVLVRDFTSFHDNEIQVDIDADPMFGRNPFVLRGESYYQTAYGRWQAIRCNDNKCIRSKKFDFEDHAPTNCSLKYAFKVHECWRNLEN